MIKNEKNLKNVYTKNSKKEKNEKILHFVCGIKLGKINFF